MHGALSVVLSDAKTTIWHVSFNPLIIAFAQNPGLIVNGQGSYSVGIIVRYPPYNKLTCHIVSCFF
jgi:hypothetical protein